MEKSFTFQPTVLPNNYKEFSVPSWDSSVANYESGKFKQSFIDFLNYLDPKIYNEYSNSDKTIFTIPHGSVIVILKIENDTLFIETPFVKLPETKFMPILRKCSEVNYSTMTLPRIKLEGDVLHFKYNMPMELCNPWKLYDILKNITYNADKYDDEFVEKFGATRIIEPIITEYPDEKMVEILASCKIIAKESLEYSQFYETKRNLNSAIDCIFIGVSRLRMYCEPTGILLNKMNETIDSLYDNGNELFDKIKSGKNLFKFIEEITQEQFKNYCSINFSLIPDKKSVNRGYLREWIENHLFNAQKNIDDKNYSMSALYSYYALCYMVCYFHIEDKDRKVIEYSFGKAANQPWKEAAITLEKAGDFFFQNTGEEFVYDKSYTGNSENDFSKVIQESVSQYKSLVSGFMSAFTGKK